MFREERYHIELTKWDALAQKKLSGSLALSTEDDFYQYAQRASTMLGITDFLGDLNGKQVLEYGCGLGEISVLLARSGAKVTAFDISRASTIVTNMRAAANRCQGDVFPVVASGEQLPYASESFDVAFGKAILHHLDAKAGWFDLLRVIKPGGKAVFVEPLGMNPFVKLARDHLPYPDKNPRGADHPLSYDEIDQWGKPFQKFHYREIQLFSMLERCLGFKKHLWLFRSLDRFLLARVPFLRRYCRYVVLFMQK